MAGLLAPKPSTNRPPDSVSRVAAPMASAAGLLEYTFSMEEPMRRQGLLCDTAEIIPMHSIPQVSGIHMESFGSTCEAHRNSSSMPSRDPRLYDVIAPVCGARLF